MAFGSLVLPSVGPVTVSAATETRIASRRSSWSCTPAGLGKEVFSAIAAGSGLPDEISETVGEVSSVNGGCRGSAEGTNSATVPVT